ncbi:MAG: tRNA (guanosine(46)-N7)-methyltransferase TrmB [Pseudomonadota bacterium]
MTNQSHRNRRLPTFVARGSRKLSDRQKILIETQLPALSIPSALPGTLDPASLFDPPVSETWLEIGFGGGEHLIGQAARNPGVGLIGCEPFIDGVAKALTALDTGGHSNIRLHLGDARDVVDRLTPASLARVFILFPDPWPKQRHHKRRLIKDLFLDDLARVLAPGASVRFATDVRHYADWAMVRFHRHPAFEWHAATAADWRRPPGDHITTRYEAKGLGDIAPVYFDFTRAP